MACCASFVQDFVKSTSISLSYETHLIDQTALFVVEILTTNQWKRLQLEVIPAALGTLLKAGLESYATTQLLNNWVVITVSWDVTVVKEMANFFILHPGNKNWCYELPSYCNAPLCRLVSGLVN